MLALDRPISPAVARNTAKASLSDGRRPMSRRHVLMLVLALEVLWLGFRGAAENYRPPPAVTVDPPSIVGHVIT